MAMGIRKRKRLRRSVQVMALLLHKAIFYLKGTFTVSVLLPIRLVSLYVYPMQSYLCFRITILTFFCACVSDIYTIHNSLNLSQDSYEIPRMLLHL
jgi:hypothetical protein